MENRSVPTNTRYILDKYGLSAKKKFGQNFLIENNVISKVADRLEENQTVIEIGAGLGALTEAMCQKVKKVIAYEIDTDLIDILHENLDQYGNVEIINQNFLDVDLKQLVNSIDTEVVIVSNLPYYITTELLTKIFLCSENVTNVITMMQKEVADRFKKTIIDKDYSPLQLMSKYYSDVTSVVKVNKNNFYPAPKVDSEILEFKIKKDKNNKIDEDLLWDVVKASFSQRRKMVISNLNNNGFKITHDQFAQLNINDTARVEQLSLEDYIRICEVINRD